MCYPELGDLVPPKLSHKWGFEIYKGLLEEVGKGPVMSHSANGVLMKPLEFAELFFIKISPFCSICQPFGRSGGWRCPFFGWRGLFCFGLCSGLSPNSMLKGSLLAGLGSMCGAVGCVQGKYYTHSIVSQVHCAMSIFDFYVTWSRMRYIFFSAIIARSLTFIIKCL